MNSLRLGIVMPAHNEREFLLNTLNSISKQSLLPHCVVIVDDNSTDNTYDIAVKFAVKQNFLVFVLSLDSLGGVFKYFKNGGDGSLGGERIKDSIISGVCEDNKVVSPHLPGAKIIRAFNIGLSYMPRVDIVCKFDADLEFPSDYLSFLNLEYTHNSNLGMCGGVCYTLQDGFWRLEGLTNIDHLRGPIKSYRFSCFESIGGLRESMGWDTADELLARYKGWEVIVNPDYVVKHMKSTGVLYESQGILRQGQVFYKLRYGFLLSLIASAKLAWNKGNLIFFFGYIKSYFNCLLNKDNYLVSRSEGRWIRSYRWDGIKKRILNIFKIKK